MKWFVARRVAWSVVALYLVLSATFFVFALTPDPNQQLAARGAAVSAMAEGEDPTAAAEQAMQAYAEARNQDRPLLDRYADWMVGYATGNWGWSFAHDAPVEQVMAGALWTSLLYLVPGVLVGTLLSVLAGLYGALNRGSPLDNVGRAAMFVGVSVPSFILAVMIQRLGPAWLQGDIVAPALIVAVNLFAVQTWITRSEALQLVPEEFVKMLRANGADTRTIGRHILRNAASPLLATFVSEVLVVLYVTVFIVEIVLGVEGIGLVGYQAFQQRDVGLILAVVMLPVMVGLVSTLLKDVASAALDPRVSLED